MKKLFTTLSFILTFSGIVAAQCIQYTATLLAPHGTVADCAELGVSLKITNTITFPSGCPGVTVPVNVVLYKNNTLFFDWGNNPSGIVEHNAQANYQLSNLSPGTYFAKIAFRPILGTPVTLQTNTIQITKPAPTLSYTINYNPQTPLLHPYNICGSTPINLQVATGGCPRDLFLSVNECDVWFNDVAPGINVKLASGTNIPSSVDVRAICQQQNYLLQGAKYYKVKLYTNPYTDYAKLIYIENAGNSSAIPYFTIRKNATTWTSYTTSPIVISSLINALSDPLFMNGSGTVCENKYVISVEESDQSWNRTYQWEWNHEFTGQVPASTDLQALSEKYGTYRSVVCQGINVQTRRMISGNLPDGSLRYHRVSLATSEPSWNSITTLVRLSQNCQTTIPGDTVDKDPEPVRLPKRIPDDNGTAIIPGSIRMDIYPNPSYGQVFVKLSSEKEVPVALQVIDISGKVLMNVINNESLKAGTNSFVIPAEMFPASGTYFIRVSAEGQVASRSLIITK